jgi:hypothetical protein
MTAPSSGSYPTIRYFGERWPSPMFEDAEECEPPEGDCIQCGEPFEADDSGWLYCNGPAVHLECGMRSVIGGVNHQLGLCICCGGHLDPDPPGLTPREAARAAWKVFRAKGQG